MANDPRAKFKITADGSDYKRKLKAALQDTDRFAGSVAQGLKRAAQAGAVALTATTIAITRMTAAANKNVDALAKQADKLGIATEKLAALQLAGRLTGVQNEKLTLGLQRMTRRIAEAAEGSGEAQGALKELGLDARQLSRLTLDEQFQRIAMAMEGVDNQSDKIRLGFKLFDSEGVDLIRTLDIMATDFARIERDATRFGVALTRVDARKIEQANDAVERASTAMQGVATNIALAIAPLRGEIANAFADAAAESQGFKDEIQSTMEALVVGANFAVNSIRGIQLALLGVKLASLRIQEATSQGGGASKAVRNAAEMEARLTGAPVPTSSSGGGPSPISSERAKIIEQIDATGRAIDALVAKFQTGEQALARFREVQAQAAQAARDSVEAQTESFVEEFVFGEEFEQRRKEREEQMLLQAEKTANKLLEIERRKAEERARIEQRLQSQVTQYRKAALQSGISLLQTFGGKSKGLAAAAIAIEKAAAVTSIIVSTNRAAAAALAPPPLGAGPIAGAPLAAAIKVAGYANAAATAALGIGQIASLGSGSTGVPLGTPTNPVFTDSADSVDVGQSRQVVEVHFHGSGFVATDDLKRVLSEQFDADEVIIHGRTRQAAEIRGRS